ncbi:hypothetical protein QF002_006901 [Paraburkholderia youngii]
MDAYGEPAALPYLKKAQANWLLYSEDDWSAPLCRHCARAEPPSDRKTEAIRSHHAIHLYFHPYLIPTQNPLGAPGPTNCSLTGFAPLNVFPGPVKKFAPSAPKLA